MHDGGRILDAGDGSSGDVSGGLQLSGGEVAAGECCCSEIDDGDANLHRGGTARIRSVRALHTGATGASVPNAALAAAAPT